MLLYDCNLVVQIDNFVLSFGDIWALKVTVVQEEMFWEPNEYRTRHEIGYIGAYTIL